MSKHTPGPWRIAELGEELNEDGYVVATPDHEIRPMPDVKLGDSLADLQLIAAAPDLLAALQELLRPAKSLDNLLEIVEKARQAITKATGGAA